MGAATLRIICFVCFAVQCRSEDAVVPSGSVRLLDASGAASSVGLLEVYMDGAFGTVCGMDSGAADVVCRMQGYDHGSVGSSPCSSYGGTNLCGKLGSTIAMKDLQCGGGEMELSGCKWTAADESCTSHDMDAVVFCTVATRTGVYADGTLRLMSHDGSPSIDGAGRLDMFRAGVWGSVCSEGFMPGSAAVACKQMGFNSGQQLAGTTRCIANGKYFCANAPHVAEVSCSGRELEITSCPFEQGEDVFCAANEGVILDCVGDGETFGAPAKMSSPRLA